MQTSFFIVQECQSADFGDFRLEKRFTRMISQFTKSPGLSVPQACEDWGATKAAYAFWRSPKVTPPKIMAPHSKKTVERLQQHSTVLLLQDTSDLDYTSLRKTKGLGYLDMKYLQGIKFHTNLAVSPQGEVLGILDQHSWIRPPEEYGKKHLRKKKPTSEKETQVWLDTQARAYSNLPQEIHAITVADREADFYELLAAKRPPNVDLLIRARHNRKIKEEAGQLFTALNQSNLQGTLTLQIGRTLTPRIAQLEIRFIPVTLKPPASLKTDLQPIPICAILARETHTPQNVSPLHWILLTTLQIHSLDQAIQSLQFYALRWLIERFHYTLKSGCKIEELQLESHDRLQKALATYSLVAWFLLHFLTLARAHPDASAELVLEKNEWKLLYRRYHRTGRIPAKPPPLKLIVLWIARLGGFLARKHDGDPGIKTLWKGLTALHFMAQV